MKKLITGYNFNSNSGIIQLTQYSGLVLENFLLVTNVSQNKIIYNFADPTTGAISFNNNILTLRKEDGKDYQWLVNDGDISGEDWIIAH
jgi:hypothetical protein